MGEGGSLLLNWLLTGQHLANSGEAQLKKTPCILQAPPCSNASLFFLFRWFLAPSPWPTMRTSFRYSFIVPHESEIKLSDHKMYLFNVQMCHNTWILCIVQQPYVQTYNFSNIKSKPFMTFFFVKLKYYWQWMRPEKTDSIGWPMTIHPTSSEWNYQSSNETRIDWHNGQIFETMQL